MSDRQDRDERGEDDPRDKRDARRPSDPRDERDTRKPGDRGVPGLFRRHPFLCMLALAVAVAAPGYWRVQQVSKDDAERVAEARVEIANEVSRRNCRDLNDLRSGIIDGVRSLEAQPEDGVTFQVPLPPIPELEAWVNSINEALRGTSGEEGSPIADHLELTVPVSDC